MLMRETDLSQKPNKGGLFLKNLISLYKRHLSWRLSYYKKSWKAYKYLENYKLFFERTSAYAEQALSVKPKEISLFLRGCHGFDLVS